MPRARAPERAPGPAPALPLGLLALEFAGSLLVAIGVAGAHGVLDALIEPFALYPRLGWFVAAAGAVLLAAALPGLLRWARENAARRR